MGASVKVYMEQGGARQVVSDGGAVAVESGGAIAVESGGEIGLGASVTLAVSGANVVLTGLPTADPAVAGALWSNSGVLTVSAG